MPPPRKQNAASLEQAVKPLEKYKQLQPRLKKRQTSDRRSKGLLKRATRITQALGTPSEWSGKGYADSRKSARRKRQFPYRRSESRLKKQAAEEAKQRAIHFRNVMGTISSLGKNTQQWRRTAGGRNALFHPCGAKGDGKKERHPKRGRQEKYIKKPPKAGEKR